MSRRRELVRTLSLLMAFVAVLVCFLFVLYDLQVTNHAAFLARTVKSVGRSETVAAARGDITDRYGRPMVTNQVIYQVTLDTSLMGDQKNAILLQLIHLAQDHGVTWPDELPIAQAPPYALTLSSAGQGVQNRFAALCDKMDWDAASGPALLDQLREEYSVDPGLSNADARALCGVLYELALRTKEVIWQSYVFASGVDIDFISAVREHALAGVNIEPVTTRKYVTSYAAHVLGRTAKMDKDEWSVYQEQGYAMDEVVGKDGVEKAFEPLLRGTSGVQLVERNDKGKIVSQSWREPPKPGCNIALTIDLPLQQKVEDTLAAKVPGLTEDVEGAAAVVLDVHSGSVLAMASYPTYDLSTIYKDTQAYAAAVQDPLEPFNNRATIAYPPGSTFKMAVAAAGLEEGIITPTTLIRDTGRYTYYKGTQPQCWIYRQFGTTHGNVNVTRAIEVSCNVFFYDVGRRVGIETIDEYARRFGLGEKTGIEIPEETGVVAGPEYTENVLGQTWYDGSTLSAAIGQENNRFTPLQLANYIATLVNGGTRYSAHLFKDAKTADYTQTVMEYEPQVVETITLDEKNLDAIKKGMLDLTTTGSLRSYFQGLPFQVGAKTGSAQVSNSTSNAVFVCFAPYDDPQVALALVAEHGGSGSDLAGLAADILEFYFNSQSGFGAAVEENTLLR